MKKLIIYLLSRILKRYKVVVIKGFNEYEIKSIYFEDETLKFNIGWGKKERR